MIQFIGDIGTVFIPEEKAVETANKLARMSETLLEHHAYLTDIKHRQDGSEKCYRLKVTVSLE